MVEFVDEVGAAVQWFYWSLLAAVLILLVVLSIWTQASARARKERNERVLDALIDGSEGVGPTLDRGKATWEETADVAIGLLTNMTVADRRVLSIWLETSLLLGMAIKWTTSPKPAMRLRGATLLVLTERPRALSVLVTLLEDPHPRVRSGAARLLGYFGDEDNVADVFGAIEAELLPPSVGAMAVLRILPQDSTLLEEKMVSEIPAVRRVAAMVLEHTGPQEPATAAYAGFTDYDDEDDTDTDTEGARA